MGWKFVLSLFFALVVATFAIQNAAAVDVDFLLWQVSISQALIVLIAAIFGALIMLLLSVVKQVKLAAGIRAEKKTIASLQNENKELKEKLNRVVAKLESVEQKAALEEQRATSETQNVAMADGAGAVPAATHPVEK